VPFHASQFVARPAASQVLVLVRLIKHQVGPGKGVLAGCRSRQLDADAWRSGVADLGSFHHAGPRDFSRLVDIDARRVADGWSRSDGLPLVGHRPAPCMLFLTYAVHSPLKARIYAKSCLDVGQPVRSIVGERVRPVGTLLDQVMRFKTAKGS
jgi:hypothetical protein